MSKPCSAFLIDPFTRTISAVDYSGDYNDIYKLIDAQLFTVVDLNAQHDSIYVDDEGLFVDPEKQAFFYVLHDERGLDLSRHTLLAGRGLVLGLDDDGDSIAPSITLEQLQKRIHWALWREGAQEAEALLNQSPKLYIYDADGNPREIL